MLHRGILRIYNLPFTSEAQRRATEAFLAVNGVPVPLPYGPLVLLRERIYFLNYLRRRRVPGGFVPAGPAILCHVALSTGPEHYPDLVVVPMTRAAALDTIARWRLAAEEVRD